MFKHKCKHYWDPAAPYPAMYKYNLNIIQYRRSLSFIFSTTDLWLACQVEVYCIVLTMIYIVVKLQQCVPMQKICKIYCGRGNISDCVDVRFCKAGLYVMASKRICVCVFLVLHTSRGMVGVQNTLLGVSITDVHRCL